MSKIVSYTFFACWKTTYLLKKQFLVHCMIIFAQIQENIVQDWPNNNINESFRPMMVPGTKIEQKLSKSQTITNIDTFCSFQTPKSRISLWFWNICRINYILSSSNEFSSPWVQIRASIIIISMVENGW